MISPPWSLFCCGLLQMCWHCQSTDDRYYSCHASRLQWGRISHLMFGSRYTRYS